MRIREVHPTNAPDVTIIIPAYNQAYWIVETLKSVLAQTHSSWECIVVNDGSTDGTADLVQAVVAQDSRLRLLTQPNGGVSSARNRGLDAAVGKFVLFLDGDDLLLPHKLAFQLEAIRVTGAEVHLSSVRVDWLRDSTNAAHGQSWCPPVRVEDPLIEFLTTWEVEYILPLHGFMTRRDLIRRTGARWNSDLFFHEDWDFWLQIMAASPKVASSSEVTAVYRVHAFSATANRYRAWKGYLQSLAVQRARYVSIPGAACALSKHFEQMHRAYRSSFPVRRWLIGHLVGKVWFRRNCPWFIQRHVREVCGI